MKPIQFQSSLSQSLEQFVAMHQASGTDYQSQSRLLMRFDRFVCLQKDLTGLVTQSMFQGYLTTCDQMKPRYKANCLGVVRQFCRYLVQTQPDCYIPQWCTAKSSEDSYNPYIIKAEELSQLLNRAMQLPPQSSLRPLMFTTIFGLLYCTGIRVGEALALNVDDLELSQQRLIIRQGKYHKSRWIYLSGSLCNQLESYLSQRQCVLCREQSSPLFISLRKTRLAHPTLTATFKKLCQQCAIHHHGIKPRLLDLRHSFATQRILQWYRQGEDVQSKLVALATHMGHVDIFSTQVYLHAIPELKQLVSQNFKRHCQTMIVKPSPTKEV